MSSYSTYTDEQLLGLLTEGSEDAFAEIYHRYAASLYTYAWNILEEEEDCKDAVEEVFIWLWEKREALQISNLRFYLRAAVKHKLLRFIQNSKRREDILATQPINRHSYTESSIELKELQSIIRQFTNKLSPRAKEVFHLSRNEYLTNREIANQLGISEKTVENHMTIVLRKLRKTLAQMLSSFFIF